MHFEPSLLASSCPSLTRPCAELHSRKHHPRLCNNASRYASDRTSRDKSRRSRSAKCRGTRQCHDAPTPPAAAAGTLHERLAHVFSKNRITLADLRTVCDGVMRELNNFYEYVSKVQFARIRELCLAELESLHSSSFERYTAPHTIVVTLKCA